jgi:hypothetical protein
MSNEHEIVLRLLRLVESDSGLTQRKVAAELGIAVGLANAFLRRCIKKGLVKIEAVPANRYLYFLTPTGFAEKGRLTIDYLSQSFGFYRTARHQCAELVEQAAHNGFGRIVLVGGGELAEIFMLCVHDSGVTVTALVDELAAEPDFHGLPVAASLDEAGDFQAAVLTDLKAPQAAYMDLRERLGVARVLVPPLLGISKNPIPLVAEEA